jgi:hypothetical protein
MSMTLIAAIVKIEEIFSKTVTAIQYEDGSLMKFNYQLEHGDWQFIDLSNIDADYNRGYKDGWNDFNQKAIKSGIYL